ncbi:MAG TPA: ATP-binding protein [Leptospiraceae bacterium]|nr:ATP-binding protein [Leptospiraceae bacterium]HMW04013.1 ATP-binding protein [Leptospiraceae bacterium]HMX30903.1 ATP-binding protein [Leptospiraceae bacterium]HMY30007.1 ATP-binding protein [Leptospiraceae bacterium]HMZ65355.1 ATP-binding protein [Leptospiraceae bacterium]
MNSRYIETLLSEISFGQNKMSFISGPRQCGKTTFGQMLLKERGIGNYCNWDDIEFRRIWAKSPKSIVPVGKKHTPILILDEIHKSRLWKRELKGLYDTLASGLDILVTGSARLNVYNRGSDSLVGRYYHFRMHPFSLGEMLGYLPLAPDEFILSLKNRVRKHRKAHITAFNALFKFGGFPEPLFAEDERKARLWRTSRIERVLREDLRDLSRIQEIGKLEMLAALIPERVGSLFSRASLREILELSFDTVTRWTEALKELYYIYEIKPWQRNISRSIKKEGKVYLWDYSEIPSPPARFENLIASHLLKACHYWTDGGYGNFELCFIRNKEKEEIDFLVTKDKNPFLAVEAKWNEKEISPHWKKFHPHLKDAYCIQVTKEEIEWKKTSNSSINVCSASEFLSYLF